MACEDRQLTEAQRVAGYQNQRTGVQQALRPFSGRPTIENILDYLNRELVPAVRATRSKLNEVFLPVVDNAPSGNPLAFYFSTSTVAADPTTGRIRLDQATQDTATTIRVSETNAKLDDIVPWLDVMAGGATAPLGVVTLFDAINPARFIRFDLNTMTDQGTYWDLGVAVVESSHDNPFVDDGAVVLAFIPGVASTGATVPPGSLSPIGGNTVIGNDTPSTAPPVEIAIAANSVLGRAGVAGTGNIEAITVPGTGTLTGESVFLQSSSLRNHVRWSNWTLAAMPLMTNNRFVGNVSGVTARPQYIDLEQLAQDLFGIGFDAATHNFKLSDILTDHFLANISGATTTPVPIPLSSVDSTSIVYDGTTHTFQRAALTGDVTSAQDSNTVTVNTSAITNAKLADMAAGTVKGRQIDAGTGAPVDLTGLEQGENLRFNTLVNDASASGTATPYSVATEVNWVRFSALTGTYTLNGCDNVESGKIIIWHVEPGTTGSLVLAHNNGGVTNLQRFFCPGAVDLVLRSGETAVTVQTVNRHRVISVTRVGIGLVDGDKTDITVSSSGTVWTIDNDVVSDAKLRNSAALSVIGRSANSTGDPADIAAANDAEVLRRSGTTLGFGTVATAGIANNAVTDAKIRQGAALTVIGVAGNATANVADIGAGTDGHVLRRSGTALGFGTIATAGIGDDQVTDAKLRNSAALSVIGRSANSTGDPADIAAANDGEVLRRSGTALGFGTVATAGITDAAVTLAKMADLAQSRIIGRAEGAGTGVPTALTPAQVVAIIDGESVTWTASHTFNGANHTVNVTGAIGITSSASSVTIAAGSDVTLAATTTIDLNSPTRLQSVTSVTSVTNNSSTAANDLTLSTVGAVRFTGPVDPLTGMVPFATGQVVMLVNAHASVSMGIHIESASSSAANRFAGVGTSRVVRPGEMALAWYDGTSSRWRLLCRDDVDL